MLSDDAGVNTCVHGQFQFDSFHDFMVGNRNSLHQNSEYFMTRKVNLIDETKFQMVRRFTKFWCV